jgi:16S rRNA (guanine527-N7)-methyltransferase
MTVEWRTASSESGLLLGRLLDAARQLDLAMGRDQATRLLAYVALLEKWNHVHSLTAWTSAQDLVVHHVLDGMTLVGPVARHAGGAPIRIADAGSGPGFPAAVLAITQPEWLVTAIDAVAKKVAFVRQAAAELRIGNLNAVHTRLERFAPPTRFDVVVSRAFGSLETFVAQTRHLLAPSGVWVAQKGQRPEAEMAKLDKDILVFHVEPVTVPGLSAERCLVWMRKVT